MGTLTGLFGYSRQAFYKHRENKAFANEAIEPLIVEKARDLRESNPGLGCVKLYLIIKNLFESTGSMPGRDAFIEIMRKHGLMVQIKRRRHYKTTDSDHPFRKYDNLIRDIVPSRPNEIWVSDITYVETEEGVCYLSLVTDAYSHRIMGWAIGPTLETCYPLAALKMALSSIDGETSSGLIHHSDRGSQYCSYAYVKELKKHNIKIMDAVTPIIPIFTYDPIVTLKAQKELYESGVYVNATLPPACAPGECLLRCSLMASHTKELIDEAVAVIARVLSGYDLSK